MRIKSKRNFRALKHLKFNPKIFLFQSNFVRWILVLALISFLWWLIYGSIFKISQILCINQDDESCDQYVIAELNNYKGESTFLIHTKDIAIKLGKANPAYQNISVIAKLPNVLEVSLEDEPKYANLKIASNSASLVVDQNYLIVGESPNPSPGLFTIVAPSAVNLGVGDQINDQTLLQTFQIANQLKQHYLSFDHLTMTSASHIKATLPDGKSAIFTTTANIPRQVTSLQLILSKATISPEPYEIDLRFDKPVLKY